MHEYFSFSSFAFFRKAEHNWFNFKHPWGSNVFLVLLLFYFNQWMSSHFFNSHRMVRLVYSCCCKSSLAQGQTLMKASEMLWILIFHLCEAFFKKNNNSFCSVWFIHITAAARLFALRYNWLAGFLYFDDSTWWNYTDKFNRIEWILVKCSALLECKAWNVSQ